MLDRFMSFGLEAQLDCPIHLLNSVLWGSFISGPHLLHVLIACYSIRLKRFVQIPVFVSLFKKGTGQALSVLQAKG